MVGPRERSNRRPANAPCSFCFCCCSSPAPFRSLFQSVSLYFGHIGAL